MVELTNTRIYLQVNLASGRKHYWYIRRRRMDRGKEGIVVDRMDGEMEEGWMELGID